MPAVSAPLAADTRASADMDTFREQARRDVKAWVPVLAGTTATRLQSSALRNSIASDRAQLMPVLGILQSGQARLADRLARHLDEGVAGDEPGRGTEPTPKSGGPLVLSLINEDRIDEDIEIARIVQALESQAEWELSQLAALCSALAGVEGISHEVTPLRPVIVARAIRQCSQDLGLDRPARLLLMRELGASAAATLPELYKRQADWLLTRGVTPARFRVRRTEAATAVPARPAARPGSAALPSSSSALNRLVAWAHDNVQSKHPQAQADLDVVPLRLLTTPLLTGEPAVLDPDTAVRVMERLLSTLADQASPHSGMGRLIAKLNAPGRRLAANDRELWSSLEHPWWQLIDRVVAAAAVNDDDGDRGASALAESLEQAVEALVRGDGAGADDCRRAVSSVEFVITGLLDERGTRIAPMASVMQAEVDREGLEHEYREQIVAQLRTAPAAAGLRQFLLGPWSIALADTAMRHGKGSDELLRRAQFVDLLLEHGTRAAGGELAPDVLDRLVRRAGRGLMEAELGRDRVVAELKDLRAALVDPGPPLASDPAEDLPALPVAQVVGLHAGLPTVPIDMDEAAAGSPASLDRRAWLDGLQPGDYCRLFMLGRWLTAQLHWRSANGSMYVFSSRHAGRLHSLSRRALDKLRAAGLAATIEHGQLIAQAMDTLTDESVPG